MIPSLPIRGHEKTGSGGCYAPYHTAHTFGCVRDLDQTNPIHTITSVETMELTLRGMRSGTVYKLETESDPPKLCRYHERYSGTEEFLELDKSIPCPIETMIE